MLGNPRFERNGGFLSSQEQSVLENSVVAIAGAGGDGGMLAVQLARMGVGTIRLADPDPFEIENINRQAVCTDSTIGVNKAVAVADYLTDINPDIDAVVYSEGVSKSNISEFVGGADLLIDETEFTMQQLAVMLAREARENRIPNLTALNVGFGAITTTYRPDGQKLESRLGFREDDDIDYIASQPVKLDRWLPYLPAYADMKVLDMVGKGNVPTPSVAPGVALAASMGATQALLNLLKESHVKNHRPDPVYAPDAQVIDVMTGRTSIIRYGRMSHYRHIAAMAVTNALRLNPKAAYAE